LPLLFPRFDLRRFGGRGRARRTISPLITDVEMIDFNNAIPAYRPGSENFVTQPNQMNSNGF